MQHGNTKSNQWVSSISLALTIIALPFAFLLQLCFLFVLIPLLVLAATVLLYGYLGHFDWQDYGMMHAISSARIEVAGHYLFFLDIKHVEANYIIRIPNAEDSSDFFRRALSDGVSKTCPSPLSAGEKLLWFIHTTHRADGLWYEIHTTIETPSASRRPVTYYLYQGPGNYYYIKTHLPPQFNFSYFYSSSDVQI